MSSMFDQFEMDTTLEQDGVWTDYGDFRVLLAHAGATNKRYTKYTEVKTRPIRRAIMNGSMSEERSRPLFYDIYAETIIKGWQIQDGVNKNGETKWKSGIHKKEGGVMTFNKENVMLTFKLLPKLFFDIQQVAESMEVFRKEILVEDSKNL